MLGLFLFHFLSLFIPSPLTFHLYKLNLFSSYICPSRATTRNSGFMICDGLTFSNFMSLSSWSFRVFCHFTICQDIFRVWVIFHLTYIMSTALVYISLYLYRQSPHLHMRFAPSYFCFVPLHIILRQLCLISHNKKTFDIEKIQLKAFRHF